MAAAKEHLLNISPKVATHWQLTEEHGRVACNLCPRNCKLRDGQAGFCRVRGNRGGQLFTFNYGKSVAATEEVIETEAVYHFSPGMRILSLGNIGCMMACTFCQNWQTSQIRYLDVNAVKSYAPADVLDICQEHNIGMVSWTYNDPVVWHEFVCETSRLLQQNGIRTLYKSAFYIQEDPVRDLIDCIDVFSISLKSMDESFYRKITKGKLGPVLDRIRQVRESGRHMEISQLVIPKLNDAPAELEKTARWVIDNLGNDVPLHFVGFHPAYRYTEVNRTSTETLLLAREVACSQGIKYCYLGNVYQDGVSDTYCDCGNLLVSRFGLSSTVVGVTPAGNCSDCGEPSPIHFALEAQTPSCADRLDNRNVDRQRWFEWTTDINSVHLSVKGRSAVGPFDVRVTHVGTPLVQKVRLGGGLDRVLVSKRGNRSEKILVSWNGPHDVHLFPVLDRAHFPVAETDQDSHLQVVQPTLGARETT